MVSPEQTTALSGKNIAVLVQNLPVPFDRRVWQESLALSAAGARVTVICPADARHPAGEFDLDGIRVLRYAAPREATGAAGYFIEYPWALAAMTRQLLKAAKGTRFDVIHFCNPPDLLFLCALPYKLISRTKLIFDQHDLGPELIRAKRLPLSPIFMAIARIIERLTYASADHVISTNESYKNIALRRGGKGADEVTVVRSGPNVDWIVESETTDRWHNGRSKMLGYVGVIGRQEGIEYLLDALKVIVFDRKMDVQLCLVGSGPDLPRLTELAKEDGLDEHVSFLGRLSDENLRSVLANADVCVNPDEVNELNNLSTMNKIVEYMALGRPIVQFDVKEGRYSAGESSRYARKNDAESFAEEIIVVLSDDALARRMGEAGRARFRDSLSWERQVPILVDAYRATLSP